MSNNSLEFKEMEMEESKELKICRICLEEEVKDDNDPENAFVSPCSCKGSSKYVHLGCLKNWIKSKKLPNKQPNDPHQHSLQSSLMSLFRSLFGLSNQPTPRTFAPNLQFTPANPAEPNLGLTSRAPQLFNLHASMNPQMMSGLTRPNFTGTIPLGTGQFTVRNTIYEAPLTGIPHQMTPQTVTVTATQIPTGTRHHEHHQHAASRPSEQLNVENNWFSNFACDVCKEILPFTVKVENKFETETANISRPENTPYLLLERLSQGKGPKVFSVVKGVENSDIRLVNF